MLLPVAPLIFIPAGGRGKSGKRGEITKGLPQSSKANVIKVSFYGLQGPRRNLIIKDIKQIVGRKINSSRQNNTNLCVGNHCAGKRD